MLFVVNKEKLYAYIVSIITVITLFCATNIVNNTKEKAVTTSTNIVTQNITDKCNNALSTKENTNTNTISRE